MTKSEIEEQKSLALAELMGWKVYEKSFGDIYHLVKAYDYGVALRVYDDVEEGLAQFAAILLKFPEVMACQFRLVSLSSGSYFSRDVTVKPTQANILDEILRMNNKWKEEWND